MKFTDVNVHKYLDSDNPGTHAECVTDNISSAFSPLATWLRTNNGMAFNSEIGGGNTASCEQNLCTQIQYLKQVSTLKIHVLLPFEMMTLVGYADALPLLQSKLRCLSRLHRLGGFASTCELTETLTVRRLLDGYSVGQAVHCRGIEITNVKD